MGRVTVAPSDAVAGPATISVSPTWIPTVALAYLSGVAWSSSRVMVTNPSTPSAGGVISVSVPVCVVAGTPGLTLKTSLWTTPEK